VTFAFESKGAYSACSVTFTGSTAGGATLASTTATLTWTPGAADHLTCGVTPSSLPRADGAATAVVTVRVKDLNNNTQPAGSYSVTLNQSTLNNAGAGPTSTTLLTTNPQMTSGGSTQYTVRATTTAGTDNFAPVITSGSLPSLPGTNTTCQILVG
jgi:hypothetical protein